MTYSTNVTRPAAGKYLFTVTPTINCPGIPNEELSLIFVRGQNIDDQFITVDFATGDVSIVIANAPNEIRSYTVSIVISLVEGQTNQLNTLTIPVSFMVRYTHNQFLLASIHYVL